MFQNCATVDEMFRSFVSICSELCTIFIPRTKPFKNRKQSHALCKALKRKSRCHKAFKRSKSETCLRKLKSAVELVNSVISSETTKFENDLSRDPDVKKFFGYVNNKLKGSPSLGVVFENGEPVSDARKAEMFNDQFASVFIMDDGIQPHFNICNCRIRISDLLFTDTNILKALSNLSAKTSCGEDGLPSMFFKKCSQAVVQPLKLIFQRSLETSELPEVWKKAAVVPIYKKGDRADVANYRPVSLTSVACRLMESIIKRALVDHLKFNNLISASQHGFLTGRSTTTNLLECLNSWTSAIDRKNCVDVMYLDIAKAFDTVSHSKLLHKLRAYGIDGKLLSWIKAFLTNRSQRVKISDSWSQPTIVTSGVPQGSVLGPILFLIYINDLPTVIRNCSISIFADDSKIYFLVKDSLDAAQMQSDIDAVWNWCQDWQLTVAAHKCNVLHIGRSNARQVYNIGGNAVPAAESVKDLGVTIASDLSFSIHINNIVKTAFQRANLIFRAFTTRDESCLLKAYFAYCRPLLEYNTSVWSPHKIGEIEKIEKVQRYFTRRLPNLADYSYPDRLSRLNIESLEERRIRFDLVEAFKIIRGFSVIPRENFFEFKPDRGTRGHKYQLRLRSVPNYDTVKYFFACWIVSLE